ncbi:Down syndrome cell adhesion molecule-like protein Dscam2, partial [Centruroides sculpturatus]|uniref:Down syndrome cell adhesion molecule-like protein Dscam2 n=2 Tax=Centruroides sculpturatus TaxID=218467 RepID=UPI000C6E0524
YLFLVPPKITPFSFPENAEEGMRASVSCSVPVGDPPISILWLKDGLPISTDVRISLELIDDFVSTLVFKSLTQEHSGTYTCVASNDAATVNFTVPLSVSAAPKWKIEPIDKSAVVGHSLLLDCMAIGRPEPRVVWKRAEESSSIEYRTVISGSRVQSLVNGSLYFREIEQEDDGRYMCEASNGVGSALSTVVKLTVNVPAYFKQKFQASVIQKGQSTELKCEAFGERPVSFVWMKDRQLIDSSTPSIVLQEQLLKESQISELRFISTRRQDTALYTCMASNPYGQDETSIQLTVLENIVLQEQLLKESQISELRFISTRRQDTALYTCMASNPYGQDETSIQLTVLDKPDPPKDIEAYDIHGRSISLKWNKPYNGNNPITRYIVEYKESTGDWSNAEREIYVDGDQTKVNIPHLIPLVRYNFRLSSENRLGRSQFSEILTVITDGEAPGGSPVKVHATPIGSSRLHVTWQAPVSILHYGLLKGYHVGYKAYNAPDDTPFTYKTVEEVESYEKSCEIRNLKRATKYRIVVQAFNDRGAGPHSDEVIVQTLEFDPPQTPSLKVDSVTSSTILLTWESIFDNENPVSGFIINWRKDGDEWTELQLSRDQISHLLTGLKCGTNYQFFITSYNNVGKGEPSDIVSGRTEGSDKPDPPKDIEAYDIHGRSISLKWNKPYNGNNPITRYIVEYKESTGDWSNAEREIYVDGDQTKVNIPHLIPLVRYNFRLSSENRLGRSQFSEILTVITDGEAPGGSPVKVHATPIGSSRLHVTWQAPVSILHYGLLKGYHVGYKAYNAPDDTPFTYKTVEEVESYEKSCEIRNLKRATKYRIVVQAFNDRGAGPHSDEVIVQTLEFDPPQTPSLKVDSVTSSTILLTWESIFDNENPVSGFIINWRKDGDEWTELQLSRDQISHLLTGLKCGTNYQFFITSYNNVGKGEPSDIVSGRTEGSAPIAPTTQSWINRNATSIILRLSSWRNGGCPIEFFVVQYKPQRQQEWILISSQIHSDQEKVVISDLAPGTWYNILVSAHNVVGVKEADYLVSTLTVTGATVQPDNLTDPSRRYRSLSFIVPICCAAVVLVAVSVAVFLLICRKRSPRMTNLYEGVRHSEDPKTDALAMGELEKTYDQNRESIYFPTPYATSNIPFAGRDDGRVDGDRCRSLNRPNIRGNEHLYDIPQPLRDDIKHEKHDKSKQNREYEEGDARYGFTDVMHHDRPHSTPSASCAQYSKILNGNRWSIPESNDRIFERLLCLNDIDPLKIEFSATVQPDNLTDPSRRYRSLSFIVPICCAAVVLVAVSVAVFLLICRKRSPRMTNLYEGVRHSEDPKTDALAMGELEKTYDQNRESIYFPTPYATSNIPFAGRDDGRVDGDRCRSLNRPNIRGNEHLYDIPQPLRDDIKHEKHDKSKQNREYEEGDARYGFTDVMHHDRPHSTPSASCAQYSKILNGNRWSIPESNDRWQSIKEEIPVTHHPLLVDGSELSDAECDREYKFSSGNGIKTTVLLQSNW